MTTVLTAIAAVSANADQATSDGPTLPPKRPGSVTTSMSIAARAGSLDRDRFPGDPSDRLIYSTAATVGAALVSADRAMRAFDPTRVVW